MPNEKNPAAQALRAIPSKKREQASRDNGRKGGRKPTAVCTCGQEPHRYNCPIYFREKQREKRTSTKETTVMFTVTYTEAKMVKGELKNLYKSKDFNSREKAEDFARSLEASNYITDVRILS